MIKAGLTRPPATPADPAEASGTAPHGRNGEVTAFMGLAVPMVVSRLGVAAFGFADGVMLARHSAAELAVQGLAEPLIGRVLDIAMVVATAGLALAAQARAGGPASAREVGSVWLNALALAALMGLAGAAVGLIGGPLLSALGQPPELLSGASHVLTILGFGVLPALIGLACAGLLEAIGRPLRVAAAVVVANLLNVALNQWLIFGGAGVPALGAVGAALSTYAVRFLLAVTLFAMLWWLSARDEFGLRVRFSRTVWQSGAEQRRRGLAAAANVAVLAVLSFGLPVMTGWLGGNAVAQVTALFLAMSPLMVIAWGFADAAGLRIAALHGEGSRDLQGSGRRLLVTTVVMLSLMAGAVFAAQRALVGLVVHQADLVDSVLTLLPLGLLALAGDALSAAYSAMLRSLGVLRGPFIAHLVTGALVLILAGMFGFTLGLGVMGLVLAHAIAATVRALTLAWLWRAHAQRYDREPAAITTPT